MRLWKALVDPTGTPQPGRIGMREADGLLAGEQVADLRRK